MFGMGFMEIFLILIVAIIALGPEKLPGALVDVAKFFKKMKGEINDAKSTIDRELDLSEMKQSAQELKDSVSNIQNMANIDLDDLTGIEDKTSSSPTMDDLTKEKKSKELPKEEKTKLIKTAKKQKVSMKKSEEV